MPEQTNGSLEKRVGTIENWFKIALGVALVFGISGSFGYSMLSTANEKIADLQGTIETADVALAKAQADIEELQPKLDKAAQIHLTALSGASELHLKELGEASDELSSGLAAGVSQEISDQIPIRVLGSDRVSCRPSDADVPDSFATICKLPVSGSFTEDYRVLTSVTQISRKRGELPPVHQILVREQTANGFEIHVQTAYKVLNSIKIDWIAVSR